LSIGPPSVKYLIEAKIEVNGVVDKNDIVGAIFGQTEGLFSSELDLRELQKSGRIGRIEITATVQGNKTYGKIVVPSALDKYSTALIAAMVESVDRVGPYSATVKIEHIHDVRAEKRRRIVERARAILQQWERSKLPEEDEILRELEESLLRARVVELGQEKVSAGPDAERSDELIIVEGRADVINLLRHGYTNAVALEGVKIPETVKSLASRKKRVIAFLDGDRGGDMILNELKNAGVKVDLVARAPYGREVEELTGREISDALHHAVPFEEALKHLRIPRAREPAPELPDKLREYVGEVEGRLMAILLDEGLNELKRVPVSELAQELQNLKDGVKYVVFDGIVTQRLVDILSEKGDLAYLIGVRVGEISRPAENVRILTLSQLRHERPPSSGAGT